MPTSLPWKHLPKVILLGSVPHRASRINHEGAHRKPPTVPIHELPLTVDEAQHPPGLWVRASPNKVTSGVTPTIPLVVVVVVVVVVLCLLLWVHYWPIQMQIVLSGMLPL